MKKLLPIPVVAALTVMLLAACGGSGSDTAVEPVAIAPGTACALDGMLLADYPGPKAQIHYAGQAEPDFFCDTVELFSIYLNPEQVRTVRGLFVQDMGQAQWDEPRGHWIDAKQAYFVHGSSRRGAMGPTLASFAFETDAVAFAEEFGGKVMGFTDITPDMVILHGGALHDHGM
ncbi:MAG: nitrous oxide reductase accessory protein NosL [Gammaproteobacteria bacterium]